MKVVKVIKKGWFSSIVQIEAMSSENYLYQWYIRGTSIPNGYKHYSIEKGNVFTVKVPSGWRLNEGDSIDMSTLLEAGITYPFKYTHSTHGAYDPKK